MEEQTDFTSKLLYFCKENILILSIFCIGTLLLGIGLIQMFSSSSSPEISYIEGVDSVSSKKASGQESQKKDSYLAILVDVSGAVIKPGVYEIASDSRIKDAVQKAGGFAQKADKVYISKSINLAQKITDGEKIYIPFVGEETSVVLGSSTGKINLNKATESELDTLSGVGKVTAQKIIKARPFTSVEQLLEKKVVSNSVFEKIKDNISL